MTERAILMTGTGPAAKPLVHHIETSLQKPPNQPKNAEKSQLAGSYHEHLRRFDPEEYDRTVELYALIDAESENECSRSIHPLRKSRLEQLETCRTFAWFARSEETHHIKVISNVCRLRWCPLCARARSRFIVHSVTEYLEHIKGKKFLTLTLKHSNAPLKFQIKTLYKHFSNFRRLKEIKKAIRGGIWFFQIKKSEQSGQWHPHVHCLIDSNFISRQQLSRLWLRTTLTSSVIDIRKIRDDEKAAGYVSRDCARPCRLEGLTPNDQYELYHALHGRRICGTWGNARQVPLNAPKVDDKSAWKKVGSWDIVTKLQNDHPAAKAIIKAFLTNKPLDNAISLIDFDDFIDNGFQIAAEKAKQLFLEFQ